VTEGIFAVLCVSTMGLTRFYKTTVFYIYLCYSHSSNAIVLILNTLPIVLETSGPREYREYGMAATRYQHNVNGLRISYSPTAQQWQSQLVSRSLKISLSRKSFLKTVLQNNLLDKSLAGEQRQMRDDVYWCVQGASSSNDVVYSLTVVTEVAARRLTMELFTPVCNVNLSPTSPGAHENVTQSTIITYSRVVLRRPALTPQTSTSTKRLLHWAINKIGRPPHGEHVWHIPLEDTMDSFLQILRVVGANPSTTLWASGVHGNGDVLKGSKSEARRANRVRVLGRVFPFRTS